MIAEDTQILRGQLWSVSDSRLFLITDVGTHTAWPIRMVEVARSNQHKLEVESMLKGYALIEPQWVSDERAHRWRRFAEWEQDREFFENRADVKLFEGTLDQWVEANS